MNYYYYFILFIAQEKLEKLYYHKITCASVEKGQYLLGIIVGIMSCTQKTATGQTSVICIMELY